MKEKQAVLETGEGLEYLTFPGPGGYRIEWSPGSVRIPLTPAPSGHLLMMADRFGSLKPPKAGGLPAKTMTLFSGEGAVSGAACAGTAASTASSTQD